MSCSLAQLMAMRDVMQGDEDNPKVPMENNCRLQMPINNRVVRTNINFQSMVRRRVSKLYIYSIIMLTMLQSLSTPLVD